MTINTPVLRIDKLTKRFGNHLALDAVSFEVREREIVALLGDNGAGKSTLVKTLAGLHKPDDGAIYLNGRNIESRTQQRGTRKAAGNGIGVVYQDLALFDNLSVAENLFAGSEICWPKWPRGLGIVKKRSMLTEAATALDRLEVKVPNLSAPVGLLSGGQRQAIAVAKGIAFAQQLVVLDEPTAALGLRERRNVLQQVARLPGTGMSVILISHNLEEVISIADRAVVLRQGRKVGEIDATAENHEAIVSMIVGGPRNSMEDHNDRNNDVEE